MKIPPPLAGTCTVSSYTSYQNFTPSGKYMHSLILHVISKSHPLWQVQGQPHLTLHDQNPTPSGKYMQGHILHVISKSHPLWQVHAQSHLTRHIKIPPPLASTCKVTSYTSYQNPTPSGKYMHSLILHVYGSWFTKHSLRAMFYESWFTNHVLRVMVYESWFTSHGLRAMVYESWFTKHSLRAMVYESRFTKHSLRAMVYRSRSQPPGKSMVQIVSMAISGTDLLEVPTIYKAYIRPM